VRETFLPIEASLHVGVDGGLAAPFVIVEAFSRLLGRKAIAENFSGPPALDPGRRTCLQLQTLIVENDKIRAVESPQHGVGH
jgi:hypothetical protein